MDPNGRFLTHPTRLSNRSAIRHTNAFRQYPRIFAVSGTALTAIFVISVPLIWGTVQIQHSMLSTRLGVFLLYLGSPIVLIVPLIAAWVGNTRLYADLGHRHLASLRVRQPPTVLLRRCLRRSFLTPGIIFFISVLSVAVLAFGLWPSLGDPRIDAQINFLDSPADATAFDQQLTGFSQLLKFGIPAFSGFYAAWSGFAAGVYGALASGLMLLLNNRILGLLIPMGVFLIQTIVAALTVGPYAALLYSFWPAGLQQAPIVVTMAPTLVLAVAVSILWFAILRFPHYLRSVL